MKSKAYLATFMIGLLLVGATVQWRQKRLQHLRVWTILEALKLNGFTIAGRKVKSRRFPET